MSGCCGEWKCRRRQPIRVHWSGFGDCWYAVTHWKATEGGIESLAKHQLDEVTSAALDVAQRHIDEVRELVAERRAARAALAEQSSDSAPAREYLP